MATIYASVDTSTLSERCRIDLLDTVAQLRRHCETLPKRAATTAAPELPTCTFANTTSRTRKEISGHDEAVLHDFVAEKEMSRYKTMQATTSTYFKDYQPRFLGNSRKSDAFRAARNRAELSGKEKDFVHRYAEAGAKQSIQREALSDAQSQMAVESYKEAFHKYRGRDPTEKELQEVGKLYFAFAEDGKVGVVQKPHFYGPHTHVSICNRRYATCPSQVFKAELPPVRHARSRFPGSIPVHSSTKNICMLTAGGMYSEGLHNVSKFGSVSH
ncbi:hypothetical protein ERJ75_001529400 [Trypanosoma vivax]|nr:hypothetical protein ERJ75_001529400 [Trypanosoma vivax]